MAVSSTTVSSGPFTANGVTTVFPFTFAAASASEVAVTLNGVALAPSAYSVVVGDNSGSVTITPALASGSILIISDPDFTQETTFSNQSALLPTVLNKINDRAVIRDLKLQSDTQRSLKLPLGSLPVDLSGTGYITISGGTVAVVAGAGTLDPNSLAIVDSKIATAVGGVNTTIAALSTTNIAEGSRQYFTNARAQAAITGSPTATVTNGVVSLTKAQLDVAAGYTVVTVNGGITFNNPIKFATDPSDPLGAATKQYVDARVLNQIPKGSVASATTGNITLSGVQTIDAVAGAAGQRVLVKDQATPSQNGIYLQATGAWTRTTDMDTWTEVPGATTFVTGGSVNINTGWSSNSSVTGTIDSTAITWTQTSNPGSYTATGGVTKTGTQFLLTPIGAGLVLGNASGTASPAPISIAALLGYTPASATALTAAVIPIKTIVTPEQFGAVGNVINADGSVNSSPTNDTTALNSFFAALGPNVRGVLGKAYAFDATFSMPLLDYGSIYGLNRYTCGLFYIGANTTRDLLVLGDGSREMLGWSFENFFVDSKTKMTGGRALYFRLCRFMTRKGLVVQGQYNKLTGGPGVVNANRTLWNGALFEDDFLGMWDDCDTVARNDGLQLVGGASSVYRGGRTMLCTTGVHIGGGASCTFDDMDVISCVQDDMLIDNALRAVANAQIFLKPGLTLDFCGRDNLRVNEIYETSNYLQVDCWLASAGEHGLHVINYGTSTFSRIQRSAGRITNCSGDGIHIEASACAVDIGGGAIDYNAGYAIVSPNAVGTDTNISVRATGIRNNSLGAVSGLVNGYANAFVPTIASTGGALTGYTLGVCTYTQSGCIGSNEFIDYVVTVTLPNPLPTTVGELRFSLPLGVNPIQGTGSGGTTDSNIMSWVRYGSGFGVLVRYDGTTPLIAGKTYSISGRIERP